MMLCVELDFFFCLVCGLLDKKKFAVIMWLVILILIGLLGLTL